MTTPTLLSTPTSSPRPSITQRVDAITEIAPAWRSVAPPAPRSVKIELTGRCNFRCSFCAHNQRLRQVGEMDRDFFDRILPEMREAGVEELGLFYLGESFLCDWLPQAVAYANVAFLGSVFVWRHPTSWRPAWRLVWTR